ncbi:hypothetical protein C8F01DRAFT_1179846 [Mycena amicta]|nr:hypothetical protein C8F01DRAFT_1179846 [Mycena amicta]
MGQRPRFRVLLALILAMCVVCCFSTIAHPFPSVQLVVLAPTAVKLFTRFLNNRPTGRVRVAGCICSIGSGGMAMARKEVLLQLYERGTYNTCEIPNSF